MERRGGIVDDSKFERSGHAGNLATDHDPNRETSGGTSTGTTGTESRSQAAEAAGEDEKGEIGLSSACDGHCHRTGILLKTSTKTKGGTRNNGTNEKKNAEPLKHAERMKQKTNLAYFTNNVKHDQGTPSSPEIIPNAENEIRPPKIAHLHGQCHWILML